MVSVAKIIHTDLITITNEVSLLYLLKFVLK